MIFVKKIVLSISMYLILNNVLAYDWSFCCFWVTSLCYCIYCSVVCATTLPSLWDWTTPHNLSKFSALLIYFRESSIFERMRFSRMSIMPRTFWFCTLYTSTHFHIPPVFKICPDSFLLFSLFNICYELTSSSFVGLSTLLRLSPDPLCYAES